MCIQAYMPCWSHIMSSNVIPMTDDMIHGIKHKPDSSVIMTDAASVSYTHLDVYKRQGWIDMEWPVGQLTNTVNEPMI